MQSPNLSSRFFGLTTPVGSVGQSLYNRAAKRLSTRMDKSNYRVGLQRFHGKFYMEKEIRVFSILGQNSKGRMCQLLSGTLNLTSPVPMSNDRRSCVNFNNVAAFEGVQLQ